MPSRVIIVLLSARLMPCEVQEVMKEPMTAADRHDYERAAVLQWPQTWHTISLAENLPLLRPGLTSNTSLRKAIQAGQGGH